MLFTSRETQSIIDRAHLGKVLDERTLAAVREKYNEPGRHYHVWNHAVSVMSWTNHACDVWPVWVGARRTKIDGNEQQAATEEVRLRMALAGLFHDYFYDLKFNDCEQRSVAFMRGMVIPGEHVDLLQVEELILATRHHGRWESEDAPNEIVRLFMDCDLATFGEQRWDLVTVNDDDVLRELLMVKPEKEVLAGRRAFLNMMLAKRRIFLSNYFYNLFEQTARENIARLLRDRYGE